MSQTAEKSQVIAPGAGFLPRCQEADALMEEWRALEADKNISQQDKDMFAEMYRKHVNECPTCTAWFHQFYEVYERQNAESV